MQNYQISRDNTYGEGACLPHPKGVGSPPSPIFAFLFMHTLNVAEIPNLTCSMWGLEGCVSCLGQPRFLSKENGVSALPTFGSSPVKPVIMPPPFNTERLNLHGNTYGKGVGVFRSATPLQLHKCVLQFVSDSRVSCKST